MWEQLIGCLHGRGIVTVESSVAWACSKDRASQFSDAARSICYDVPEVLACTAPLSYNKSSDHATSLKQHTKQIWPVPTPCWSIRCMPLIQCVVNPLSMQPLQRHGHKQVQDCLRSLRVFH